MVESTVFGKALLLFVAVTWQLLAPVASLILGQHPRCNSGCLYEYMPVCGSNGRTYPNMCFLFMDSCRTTNLVLARLGPCVIPDPCNIVCTRIYDPVCGSDGMTYNNPCNLMYASCVYISRRITPLHSGRCASNERDPSFNLRPPPTPRPRPPSPTTTTRRPSVMSTECPFGCSREYIPVCGSDGVTYPNECSLNMVTCWNRNITKVKDGKCDQQIFPPTTPRCPLSCNKVYNPICGSDDITYINLCTFTMASCKDSSLVKVNDGPCSASPEVNSSDRPFCAKDCPFTYMPLCGTDDVTYTNKCTFDVAVCRNATLKVQYKGNCIWVDERETHYPAPVTININSKKKASGNKREISTFVIHRKSSWTSLKIIWTFFHVLFRYVVCLFCS